MSIGKAFSQAARLFSRDTGPLTVAAAIATALNTAVVYALLQVLIFSAIGRPSTFTPSTEFSDWIHKALGRVILTVILGAIVSLIVYSWSTSAMVHVIIGRVRNLGTVGFTALRAGFAGFGAIFVALILTGLAGMAIVVVGGFIAGVAARGAGAIGAMLFLALVLAPLLALVTLWAFVPHTIVDRGVGALGAMSGSMGTVRRVGFWKVLATLMVGGLCYNVVDVIITSVLPGRLGGVAQLFFSFMQLPVFIVYTTAMYFQAIGEDDLVEATLHGRAAPGRPDGAALPPSDGASGPTGGLVQPVGAAPPPPPAPPAPGDGSVTAGDPAVDGATGTLQPHCTQCGALLDPSSRFCSVCAAEVSGGQEYADEEEGGATDANEDSVGEAGEEVADGPGEPRP